MSMEGLKNRATRERIDVFNSIRPMSSNMPGHEQRMIDQCARVQTEFFDTELHREETTGKQSEKG